MAKLVLKARWERVRRFGLQYLAKYSPRRWCTRAACTPHANHNALLNRNVQMKAQP
jgi:hypothetical protein